MRAVVPLDVSAIMPRARTWSAIWQAARAVRIPVIGMGGIATGRDALEFLIAGAHAVAVGSMTFMDPATALRVVGDIEEYLTRHGFASVNDLVGTLEFP